MKRKRRGSFKALVDGILQSSGHSCQDIHLQCYRCGDEAFAKSIEIATTPGGWTGLRQLDATNFAGLCIECNSPNNEHEPTKEVH